MAQTAAAQPMRWAREYETIYILRPNVDPDEADKIAKRVAEVVDRFEGKITRVDTWGKRKLAYPIAKLTRGIFVYVKYVAYGTVVAELERNLRMLDAVIRYQTVQTVDKVDPSTLEIDPEEVKFSRIEPTIEEEEEPGIEQRLGLLSERPRRMHDESAEEVSEEAPEEEAPEAEASADEDE